MPDYVTWLESGKCAVKLQSGAINVKKAKAALFILLWHTLSHASRTKEEKKTLATPTIYLQKVNRIGFIGFCIQDMQPTEITAMNIYGHEYL